MSRQWRLWCFITVEGESTASFIDAPVDRNITELKDLIWDRNKLAFASRNLDANYLTLYKLDVPVPIKPSEDLAQRITSAHLTKLDYADTILESFPEPPTGKHIHIIVELPEEHRRKKQRRTSDISSNLMEEWVKPDLPLPDIGDLEQYLNGPLSNDQKIPVQNDFLEEITQSGLDIDALSRADAESLFRATEHETANLITTFVKSALFYSAPEAPSSESTYHSFWDFNIRHLLAFALKAQVIRDSNKSTSSALTALNRPDFGLLVNGICVLRGEEKAPLYAGKHPRDELFDKLTWTYDPAPYVLAYHAVGATVTLSAITKNSIVDLAVANLSHRSQRVKNFVRIIKICSIIPTLQNIIGGREVAKLVSLVRQATGTIIKLGSSGVEKKYIGTNRTTQVQHLQKVYDIMREKSVPNVDELSLAFVDDPYRGSVVYLQPKGVAARPVNARDVIGAVSCILAALEIMHAEPEPLLHRDIRWPNIIRSGSDSKKWFLIDWDDASTFPTSPATHLNPKTHCSSVFQVGHGTEVDIWAVGKLLVDAVAFCSDIPDGVTEYGRLMMKGQVTSAAAALQHLRNLPLGIHPDQP